MSTPLITLEQVKKNPVVETFVRRSNEFLGSLGYTEHGFRHIGLVSTIAKNILERLGYPPRVQELTAIAGYMHDIGNVVNRNLHAEVGATLVFDILMQMGMDPEEIAHIVAAVGNHDEKNGLPVNAVSAALILADKADVHRSRVRNTDFATFDVHDRVNYAVEHSFLRVDEVKRTITLELTIDIEICPVLDYFEIFMTRMMLSRRAADFLGCQFELFVNGSKLL
ncbi:MAG TPA: HD domain-containing protein [Bacillota bacterium]|nr:HD domain-containing protein [Bacillota bacterium]